MAPPATVSACTVILIALGFLGSYPHHLARWSVELRMKKWFFAAALLQRSYSWVAFIHQALHSGCSPHRIERTARIVWEEDLSFVVEYLVKKTGEPVIWETNEPVFLRMFKNIYSRDVQHHELQKDKLGKADIDWVKLGFQGKDPATDFRSTGQLGLELFSSFCESESAERVFVESGSYVGAKGLPIDVPWYPVALVSIRLTHFLTQKLLDSPARVALMWRQSKFRKEGFAKELTDFHVNLLFSFHSEWMKQVADKKIVSFVNNEVFIRKFEEATNARISSLARAA